MSKACAAISISSRAGFSTALWQIGELQARRGRATIGGQLVPFSRVLDVGFDHDRAEPFDNVRIVGRAERQRRVGAAGVGGELKQHPRRGEIAVVEGIFAAPNQRIDFILVEHDCGFGDAWWNAGRR